MLPKMAINIDKRSTVSCRHQGFQKNSISIKFVLNKDETELWSQDFSRIL